MSTIQSLLSGAAPKVVAKFQFLLLKPCPPSVTISRMQEPHVALEQLQQML